MPLSDHFIVPPCIHSVASAVCQRYIAEILSNSLSPNPSLQRLAVDILSSIARSGFGHPLSVSPTLIALTSAPDAQIAQKAFSMLSLLHQKHASLLATRFLEPAKVSFEYSKVSASVEARGAVVQGWTGKEACTSCFGRWFK